MLPYSIGSESKSSNAFSTPEKQGYGIHPTRDEVDSEHWKNVKTNEGLLPMFEDFK